MNVFAPIYTRILNIMPNRNSQIKNKIKIYIGIII